MNRLRLIKTAYTALAALMLASCASDELADGTVQDLPDGKYPLQISSVTMSAESTAQPWGADAPQSRVAENITNGNSSAWEDGDLITVQIGDDATSTCTYSVDVDASGNVTGLTTKTTLYWKNKTAQKVKGWYPADITNDISLKNQGVNGTGLAYALYAETANTVDYQTQTPIELPFSHQLAKVRVVLEGSGKEEVKEVKVLTYPACKFTPNDATTKIAGSGTPEYIPMKETTYDNGVTYWEANVVPGYTITKLKVNDTDCTLEGSGVTPVAGQWHKVTITVKDPLTGEIKLSDYSDGATLRVAGTATIKGNNQSKDLKIIIKNGAKVTLDNVILNASTAGNVITCQNNATITLIGSNNITGYMGTSSAILVEGGILTIEGTGSLEATGMGGYSCGIGAINSASIVINSGSITAIGGTYNSTWGCPGIGPVPYKKACGDITINGGTIDATGGPSAAGIGSNLYCICGNILIRGEATIVNAKGGSQVDGLTPADIGKGVYGTCGNVTFTGGATVNGQKYN